MAAVEVGPAESSETVICLMNDEGFREKEGDRSESSYMVTVVRQGTWKRQAIWGEVQLFPLGNFCLLLAACAEGGRGVAHQRGP